MAIITAICNQKGGVGKTTFAVNLGKNLAALRKRVLVIDNDPQGNLTTAIFGSDVPDTANADNANVGEANAFGLYIDGRKIKPFEFSQYLHVVGANKKLADVASMPWDVYEIFQDNVRGLGSNYDYILIDCPPTLGNAQIAAFFAANNFVIPTHLDSFSVKGLDELMKDANKVRRRGNSALEFLGVIINEVSGKLNEEGRPRVGVQATFYDELERVFGDKVFATKITKSSKMSESHAMSEGINDYSPKSEQALQYTALTEEFITRTEGVSHEL